MSWVGCAMSKDVDCGFCLLEPLVSLAFSADSSLPYKKLRNLPLSKVSRALRGLLSRSRASLEMFLWTSRCCCLRSQPRLRVGERGTGRVGRLPQNVQRRFAASTPPLVLRSSAAPPTAGRVLPARPVSLSGPASASIHCEAARTHTIGRICPCPSTGNKPPFVSS